MERLYKLILTIIVIVGVVIFGINTAKKIIITKVEQEALESVAHKEVTIKQVKELNEILNDSEKDIVVKIAKDRADSIINYDKIKSLIQNRSINEIKEFILSDISDDEKAKLVSIYSNHKDDIDNIIYNEDKQ